MQTGTGRYDIIINCSTYYGDYISNDWILPIDKYFNDPRMPKWDRKSISPAVASLYKWGNHWYGSNNDHDAHVLYFRKDIISDPKWQAAFKKEVGHAMPVKMDTWDDVYEICKFFNGKDWNGDGKPDHGITLHLKVGGQGFFHFMALSAPYVVIPYPGKPITKVDRYHNVYWFDPVTMEPLINSPGHVAALEMLIKLSKTGTSAMWGWSLGEAWADFLSGKAIVTFSWGDVGSLAEDPTQSVITGKLGARGIPGTKFPYDMQQKKFLKLDKPNMVGNQVGCSWHPVLSKLLEESGPRLLLDGLAGNAGHQPLERVHGMDRRGSRHQVRLVPAVRHGNGCRSTWTEGATRTTPRRSSTPSRTTSTTTRSSRTTCASPAPPRWTKSGTCTSPRPSRARSAPKPRWTGPRRTGSASSTTSARPRS